jgi:hypothetical protein
MAGCQPRGKLAGRGFGNGHGRSRVPLTRAYFTNVVLGNSRFPPLFATGFAGPGLLEFSRSGHDRPPRWCLSEDFGEIASRGFIPEPLANQIRKCYVQRVDGQFPCGNSIIITFLVRGYMHARFVPTKQ